VRHDNTTAVMVAPVDILARGGAGANASGGAPTYAARPPGYLAAGDDVLSGVMSLADAEAMCTNHSGCVAFTFEGAALPPAGTAVLVRLKSAVNYVAGPGWFTFVSSRAGDDLGGDEDGPDSTWILDPPLQAAPPPPAGAASVRSFNRPGEFLACAAPPAGACAIAHNTGGAAGAAAFAASATFVVHTPGLTGAAGSRSFESVATPGAYVSWFGNMAGNGTSAALTLQANQPGSPGFAAASTFDASGGPNWLPPTLAYVATTADGSVAGSRDLLLYPIADIVNEWYGVYVQVVSPTTTSGGSSSA
jgi:hypothetical protein